MLKKIPKIPKIPKPFYHCEICDYSTCHKGDFSKHLQTIKHNAKKCYVYANENPKYICYCGKSYKHQSSYSRHINICKKAQNDDKWITNGLQMDDTLHQTKKVEFVETAPGFTCVCGKTYKYRQGLHKHKMKCKAEVKSEVVAPNKGAIMNTIKEILPELIENNSVNINVNNNVVNNVVNNTEQINIYLNETCKNAMTIQDFTKTLKFTIEDLLMKKRDCLTNILLKNIQPLSIYERPFHCTDVRNKEWHIKDEKEGWEQDSGEKIIRNAEFAINKQWTDHFEKVFPNWMEQEGLKDVYVKVTQSATSYLPKKEEYEMLKDVGEEVLMKL
jgi:hypothetical protein